MSTSPLKSDSREQFECWANKLPSISITGYLERCGDSYADDYHQALWQAWQAARAAIVVEPPKAEFFLVWDGKKHSATFTEATENYSAILRAAGITVKGD